MNDERPSDGRAFKGARIEKSEICRSDIDAINGFTLEELSDEDVFTFKIAMCDNNVDRDNEAFDEPALKQMAGLFVGKTTIKDHNHKADNQIGRIYACSVEQPGGLSDTGEPYMQLVAKCYVLVNDANASLIADIKGGIKKEVSVGFRLGSYICSVCGTDNAEAWCKHVPGREYDGRKCHFTMSRIEDAYEMSFVSVPAQREAGVVKLFGGAEPPEPDPKEEEKQAIQGREYGGEAGETEEIEIELSLTGSFLFEEENTYEQEDA